MRTVKHKQFVWITGVILLLALLTPPAFARNDKANNAKAQASASSKTDSRSQAQSKASQQSSRQSTPAASSQSRSSGSQVSRQAAPSQSNTNRSAQSTQTNSLPRTTPSVSTVVQTRTTRSVSSQASSQTTQKKSAGVPGRSVNRTVEVVSTAAMNNNASSNRFKTVERTSSVSSAGKSKPKNSVSRTVITPSASGKSKASVATSTSRNRAVATISPSKSKKTSQSTFSSAGIQKIFEKKTGSTVRQKLENSVDRISAKKSSTTFDYFGSASQKKPKQTASIDIKTDAGSGKTHEKITAPVRVKVDDIKIEPQRVVVSDKSPKADFGPKYDKGPRNGMGHDGPGYGGSQRHKSSSQIIINNDNRVIVKGSPTPYYPRPYISRCLYKNIAFIRKDPCWIGYGSSFYFSWSSSSCGIAVCLPYYYSNVYYCGTPYYGISYFYPRYHRKYIFVSIGGYWPCAYRYRRYYWYGCHPYYWYGARVIYNTSPNVTYNTYNYYNTTSTSGYGFSGSATPYYTLGNPKDEIIDEPQFETAADLCFDHAVKLFAAGNYEDAVEQFREAVNLSPDDVILPFTYSQALFANGEYAHAAAVLRAALANIPENELTIYFPRGLYEDETVLNKQIEKLKDTVKGEPFAADYQLLLGYQYLGFGELEKAHMPLMQAAKDPANEQAAGKLLDLAAQLEKEAVLKQ